MGRVENKVKWMRPRDTSPWAFLPQFQSVSEEPVNMILHLINWPQGNLRIKQYSLEHIKDYKEFYFKELLFAI